MEKPECIEEVEEIFDGWQETLIWSCLQGVMGEIYTDHAVNPSSAMALLGDFCFLAGVPNEELTRFRPAGCSQDFVIMVPRDERWAQMIEGCYKDKAKKVIRYAFHKEPDRFCREKLEEMVSALPAEYTLRMLDEDMFHWCRDGQGTKEREWCRDWVSQYADYERNDIRDFEGFSRG